MVGQLVRRPSTKLVPMHKTTNTCWISDIPVRTPTRSFIHSRCTINHPVDEVTESISPNSIQPRVQRRLIQHWLIALGSRCL